jgi:cytochrome c oxidase cbb3-type subunit III
LKSRVVVILFAPGLIYIALAQTSPPTSSQTVAPTAAPGAQTAPAATGGLFPPAYPARPPADPAIVQHGKQLFSVSCGFCHGSDARGGETGPNLVRSQLVLDDQHGELIASVVRNGRMDKGMPKFDMSDADISDIAMFLHSQPVNIRGLPPSTPINILVGDAKAGEAYFNGPGKCNTCHSVSGDLAGIGRKYDPKTLQNRLVSGGGGGQGFGGGLAPASRVPPTTVTVTLPSGQKYEGKLAHLDAFDVALVESDGTYRSVIINGASPKVEVHNPLRPHIDMLPTFKDTDIHNLTAYLVTVK